MSNRKALKGAIAAIASVATLGALAAPASTPPRPCSNRTPPSVAATARKARPTAAPTKRCLANQLKENGGIGSISEQLLDTRADVTIGGGSKYFRQTVQGGECAGKTVWEQAKEMGYQTVENDPAAIAMIVKTAKISR